MAHSPKSIAVLGAGLTGLAAAHRLHALGHRVRLFEQSDRVGGAVRTELTDGWLIEAGPNSLQENADLAALIAELDLGAKRVEASPLAKNRFLVRRGRVLPLPTGPGAFLATPLCSLGAKLRLPLELFARPRVRTTDLSLASFVRSHVGQDLVDYALQPVVSGIYAGDPEKLSTRYGFPKLWALERKHGSLVRGGLATAKAAKSRGEKPVAKLISFRRGLQTLPAALAARLPSASIALNARVDCLIPPATARSPQSHAGLPAADGWSVLWHDGAAPHTESSDSVVSALPAPALARLAIGPHGERPLALLDAIEHPPVSSLFLGFRRDQVTHPLDGFGVLVPALERRNVLGILFSSSLFPGRAPEGHVALTVMLGGALRPELARRSTAELLATVRTDLRELLGVTGDPVFQRHTFWPRAIPQYNLGYARFLESIAACERTHDGLVIGGQCRDGISVPQCLAAGETLAARALA